MISIFFYDIIYKFLAYDITICCLILYFCYIYMISYAFILSASTILLSNYFDILDNDITINRFVRFSMILFSIYYN